ncbi:beta-N-acetylhexosaminidase [Brevundimonas denitrificans]|uniref:beta-N-acetylhexosaminidase n=1 Tax=Brevundimonas denitrificans TaxID=1443434 RepID=UPI00223A88C3|nr:family 20 glycosylhydrolase [Brevundimonas denitrificans]
MFRLDAATVVRIPPGDAEAARAAAYFIDLIRRTRGLELAVSDAPGAGIVFERNEGGAEDAYGLAVGPGGATIGASDFGGLLYGGVSLWQLATAEAGQGAVEIAATTIEDAPRFGWRGLMLDSARHFQSIEMVRDLIDVMATHKLNVLHWHLTDDQAWRLEINAYPRLTEVGAWRQQAGAAGFDETGEPLLYGGFYTQDQVREIVAYAAALNITVVPEIEMPGHALAAVVAYPELGSVEDLPDAVFTDWGVFPWLFNIEDGTFEFLETVLDEVMALFPSEYIHIGGDEAVKDQWEANAHIQARMAELGVADENELQSWFVRRIERHLNANGRRLIGWDEILEGGLAPNATVMSWRGIDGAIEAARMGHDTVLTPAPVLYFDHRQSHSPDESPGRGAVISTRDVYAFDPAPDALTEDQLDHILGVQGNVWTEHIRTEERLWDKLFPRMAAVAELAWSPPHVNDWAGFAARLPDQLDRYEALGVTHATIWLEPMLSLDLAEDDAGIAVALSNELGAGEIRYTTDGGDVTSDAAVYEDAVIVQSGAVVRASTWLNGEPIGREREWTVSARDAVIRTSHQLAQCTGGLVLALEDDAPRGPDTDERAVLVTDILNPCWVYEGGAAGRGDHGDRACGVSPLQLSGGRGARLCAAASHVHAARRVGDPAGQLRGAAHRRPVADARRGQ